MTTQVLEVAYQNMTEGHPSPAVKDAHLFGASEVDIHKVRQGMPKHRVHNVPRDKGQAILWNPRRFKVEAKGYVQFHKSGDYEKFPYGTPGRGLLWIRGYDRLLPIEEQDPTVFGVMWWLNSWKPMKNDHNTGHRQSVVNQRTIPKVERWVQNQHQRDRRIILMGDTNSMRWDGHLDKKLIQFNKGELDRAWVTRNSGLIVKRQYEGPKVGVGNQMQHHSLHLNIVIRGK